MENHCENSNTVCFCIYSFARITCAWFKLIFFPREYALVFNILLLKFTQKHFCQQKTGALGKATTSNVGIPYERWFEYFQSSSLTATLWRAEETAQAFGPLQFIRWPDWSSRIPASAWPSSSCYSHLGSEPESASLPFKQERNQITFPSHCSSWGLENSYSFFSLLCTHFLFLMWLIFSKKFICHDCF